jgi:hypothetical protein
MARRALYSLLTARTGLMRMASKITRFMVRIFFEAISYC